MSDQIDKPTEQQEHPHSPRELETLAWFEFPATFLIIAKRYSGKTHLLKWMMSQLLAEHPPSGSQPHKNFDLGIIVSRTAKATGEWNILPNKYIISNYDEDIVKKLYEYCDKKKRQKKPVRMFMIFDDIVGFVNLKTDFMGTLITTARHIGISLFFISQKMTDTIPPVLRTNSDYVFVFKNQNMKEVRDVWEEYGSALYNKFNDFADYVTENIGDYKALVINKKTQSNNWQDIYRIIRAPANIPNFFFDPAKKQNPKSNNEPNQPIHKVKPSSIPPKASQGHYSGFAPRLSKYL